MAGERVKLVVQERESRGTRPSRRLRREGLIPGVLYGQGKTPHAICVPERELRRALTGSGGLHTILDVVLEGQTTPHHAVLKEYQQDPIRGRLTHVDFHEVRLDRPIQASVAVQLVGEPAGVDEGGVLSQVTREVNVEALPMEIPEHLELDVSGMAIGESRRRKRKSSRRARSRSRARPPRRPRAQPRLLPSRAARPPASPAPPRARPGARPCACFVEAARRLRRSISSSRVSAIPGASTGGRGTTSAGWSRTSSRAGTAARSARSSRAGSPRCASEGGGSRCSGPRRT